MKKTMYELLGMVKDGKAPKNIKCYGYIFEYDTNHLRYESYFDGRIWTLNDFVNVDDNLNDEVEILEEPKGIPEKLYQCRMDTDNDEIEFLLKQINIIVDRYNDLLDYFESKGE